MTDLPAPFSLDTSLDDLTLAYVDVETTGLEPSYGDRICEVAILRCACGETLERYEQLVNPLRPISPGAFAVNRISEAMLRDAPTFPQVAARVSALLDGAAVVGHNVAFDLGFLSAELRQAGQPLAQTLALDTCRLARHTVLAQGYSLSRLSRHFGLPSNGREHRAMADAETTRALFERLVNDLWRRGVRSLGDLLQAQGGAVVSRGQPAPLEVPPLIQDALRNQQLLQLTYTDEGGCRTERLCRPVKLLTWEGRVTLVAHCYLRQAVRHFRLDRVAHMELVEPDDERALRALSSDAEGNRDARDA
ncbi:MAG: WYL domain-containing protein [Chloroflexi bacterium]|nr:WYL domain-containing protein [Chloroflexota bacterium]